MGQFSHFDLVFEGDELAKWYNPKEIKVEHMGFGIVLGDDGQRMKTRGGKTVRLMRLLDEAKDRAMETLKSRGQKDAEHKEEEEEVNEEKAKHVQGTKLSEEEWEDAAEKMGI